MAKKWASKTKGGPSIEGCEVRNIRYVGIYGHPFIYAELLRLGSGGTRFFTVTERMQEGIFQ